MSFFGMGPVEIGLIAVLALVVVGPKQLPALLKQMGGWFTKAQDLQREFRRGVDDIVRETELSEVTKTVSKVRNFTPAGAATSFLNAQVAEAEASTTTAKTSSKKAEAKAEAKANRPSAASDVNEFAPVEPAKATPLKSTDVADLAPRSPVNSVSNVDPNSANVKAETKL